MLLTCGCQRWQLPTLALRNSEAAVCSAPICVNYQPLHVGLCKDMVGELCTAKQRHVQIWLPPPPSESLKNQEVCPHVPVDLSSLSFPSRKKQAQVDFQQHAARLSKNNYNQYFLNYSKL